ncbi:cytochrome P450 6l1-like [Solenopsis invicta]|uniref:cytochrome P450 6l1-like n=1 Tax=Solenopsis invicta TaxID=13686 RepID=UPI00193E0F4D|nr:cytochrome P450 6l1-like [Solenopsis invicta]
MMISYEAANEMKYFQNIINGTLRKYPPLSILFRKCTRDMDLSDTDIHISKETIIIIPVLGLHRHPTIYPDPDFDPERFTEANKATRHSFAYYHLVKDHGCAWTYRVFINGCYTFYHKSAP